MVNKPDGSGSLRFFIGSKTDSRTKNVMKNRANIFKKRMNIKISKQKIPKSVNDSGLVYLNE
ncbi:hypothetical protein GCM10008119_11040 [Pedobacter mendelii]|uniref:Uncharacterized protein n=1 Tax=Pedobacter mendelii TaxID=1908240 RepID=A0ABQ2BGK0_9SPHI|nr:hypothetical protein GCM10008119_11040 [Pedobacter mendelii]